MKPSILIVDDEKDTRELMARALGADYNVTTAADAELAIKALEDNPQAYGIAPTKLRDPEFVERKSERNMALVHSNALAGAFAAEAHALLDRLAAPAPREARFGAAFLADAETAPPDAIAAASAASFPAAFRQGTLRETA